MIIEFYIIVPQFKYFLCRFVFYVKEILFLELFLDIVLKKVKVAILTYFFSL